MLDQFPGDREVRDDTASHGPDGTDISVRASDHAFRLFANGKNSRLAFFIGDSDH